MNETTLNNKKSTSFLDINELLEEKNSEISRAIDMIFKDFPVGEVDISRPELYGSFNPFDYEASIENERVYTKAHREKLVKDYETRRIEVFDEMVIQIKSLIQKENDIKKFMFEIQRWVIKKSMSLTFDEGLKSFYPHLTGYINKTLSQNSDVKSSVLYRMANLNHHVTPSKFQQSQRTKQKFNLRSLKLLKSNHIIDLEFLHHFLEELSLCLDLPDELIGFRGELSFEYCHLLQSFFSGESNGKFCPGDFKIFLKSSSGFDTLSHEWAHALEYYLSKLMKLEESQIFSSKRRIKNNKEISANLKLLLLEINECLEHSKYQLEGRSTRMLITSQSRKYILSKTEIFARTFEKYVRLKQIQKGLLKDKDVLYDESKIMPTNDEVQSIVPLLDRLIEEFRQCFHD